MTTHPADREVSYVLSYEPGVAAYLSRSDDGRTWTRVRLQVEQLEPDPRMPDGFYGIAGDSLQHSADGGATWLAVGTVPEGVWRLAPSPVEDGMLYGWGTPTPLYRTPDHGLTWQAVAIVPGLEQLAQMPGWPEGLVARSYLGQPLISHDRGQTFAPVGIAEATELVSVLWYDPAARLHAASMRPYGSKSAIRSLLIDDGPGWARRGDVTIVPYVIWRAPVAAVFQDPLRPEVLLAALANGHGTYGRSEDGGRTWSEVPLELTSFAPAPILPRAQIAADPSREGVYLLAQEGVWRSADYGVTWEEIGPWAAAKLDPIVRFSRSAGGLVVDVDSARLYVAFNDSLWHTADDGQTWSVRGRIQPRTVCFDLVQAGRQRQLLAATWDGLFRSEDEGRTWTRRLAPEGSRWQTARLRPDPTDDDGLYLVTDRRLYASRDGGVRWDAIEDGFGGAAWLHDVAPDPLTPGRFHVATSWGLYRVDGGTATAVAQEASATPARSRLGAGYPNPFNGEVAIPFAVGRPGPVALEVYDLLGQRLRRVLGTDLVAGEHTARWDGRDEAGRPVATGVYLCRLEAPGFRATRKLLLVR